MTKYNFKKEMSKSRAKIQAEIEYAQGKQYRDYVEWMKTIADHLGVSTEEEGLADRIGLDEQFRMDTPETRDDKVQKVKFLASGWITRGSEFVTVAQFELRKQKDKKGKVRQYARLQLLVSPEWVGHLARVTVPKGTKPRLIFHIDEIYLDELDHVNPSKLAEIVKEPSDSEVAFSKTVRVKPHNQPHNNELYYYGRIQVNSNILSLVGLNAVVTVIKPKVNEL